MRKRFFFILSIVFSIAMMASPVSQQSALQEAMRFMKWQQAATSKPKMVKRGTSLNRSGADNASYYIFNAPGGEQGWAIVSGDDRTAPVLAYSPQGTIDPGRLSPAMQALLADYERQLQALSMMDDATARRSLSAAARVPVATRHSIAPLIASKWDQATPYWNLCPQFMNSDGSGELAYTGCVATSIAQVMNYHKWPKTTTRVIPSYTFTYSNGGYDYGTATTEELPVASFDWDHMRNSYTGAEDEASIHAVAQLATRAVPIPMISPLPSRATSATTAPRCTSPTATTTARPTGTTSSTASSSRDAPWCTTARRARAAVTPLCATALRWATSSTSTGVGVAWATATSSSRCSIPMPAA